MTSPLDLHVRIAVLEMRVQRVEQMTGIGRDQWLEDDVRQRAAHEFRLLHEPGYGGLLISLGRPGGPPPPSSFDQMLRDNYGVEFNEHGGPDPDTADSAALSTNPNKE